MNNSNQGLHQPFFIALLLLILIVVIFLIEIVPHINIFFIFILMITFTILIIFFVLIFFKLIVCSFTNWCQIRSFLRYFLQCCCMFSFLSCKFSLVINRFVNCKPEWISWPGS